MGTLFQSLFALFLIAGLAACGSEPASKQAAAQIASGLINGKVDSETLRFGVILKNQKVLCSGTVIGARVVLTAAHCTQAFAHLNQPVQILKTVQEARNQETKILEIATAQAFATHAAYDPKTDVGGFDLGLVLADRDLTSEMQILSLVTESWSFKTSETLFFVGAGSQNTRPRLDNKPSEVRSGPHEGTGRVIRASNLTVLRDLVSPTARPLQAGDVLTLWRDDLKNTYVCDGDSGGTLFRRDMDGQAQQVGVIVSTKKTADGVCYGSEMTVTPVSVHQAWIREASARLLEN